MVLQSTNDLVQLQWKYPRLLNLSGAMWSVRNSDHSRILIMMAHGDEIGKVSRDTIPETRECVISISLIHTSRKELGADRFPRIFIELATRANDMDGRSPRTASSTF